MSRIRKKVRHDGSKRKDGRVEHESRSSQSVQQIVVQDSNFAQCRKVKEQKDTHFAFGTKRTKTWNVEEWMRKTSKMQY
jgi:hypothetical protein